MDTSIILEIINTGLVGKVIDDQAFLIEKSKDATLTDVMIKGLENGILLSCDKIKSDTLYKGSDGPNKRCDYILINKEIIYFLELKSNKKSNEIYRDECILKFKAVECLLDYIDSVISKFHNKQIQLNSLSKKFVLLYLKPSIAKTTTSLKPHIANAINDKPENLLSIAVDNNSTIDITKLSS